MPGAEVLTLRLVPRRKKKVRWCKVQEECARTGHKCRQVTAAAVQAVRWASDVVDNEELNKKKSKSALQRVPAPLATWLCLSAPLTPLAIAS